MEQLLIHLFSDYWLQNDWMALNKKKNFWVALLHSVIYTIPFLLITDSWLALLGICVSHAIIDFTPIVNKLNQLKNWDFLSHYLVDIEQFDNGIAKHVEKITEDGYNTRPMYIRVWLLIIQDNTLHLILNYLCLEYL